MPSPREAETPSLLGKLAKGRRTRPQPEPDLEPLAADLDPAAFEATTAFSAVGADRPETQVEQTARFDAIGPDPTATFDAIDLQEHADVGEPAFHSASGLGPNMGERRSSPLSAITRMRRPSNHVLGLVLSLGIGVGVGIAIIALVLWPQLKDDDDPPPESANASNNRPVTTIPASFAGTWKGEVVNTTRNASFPVEITFESGGTTANALYPKEQCKGTLRLTRGTESALRMTLDISAPCTSGVVQITRQPDGTLQYTWNRPGTNLGYGGRLSRN